MNKYILFSGMARGGTGSILKYVIRVLILVEFVTKNEPNKTKTVKLDIFCQVTIMLFNLILTNIVTYLIIIHNLIFPLLSPYAIDRLIINILLRYFIHCV